MKLFLSRERERDSNKVKNFWHFFLTMSQYLSCGVALNGYLAQACRGCGKSLQAIYKTEQNRFDDFNFQFQNYTIARNSTLTNSNSQVSAYIYKLRSIPTNTSSTRETNAVDLIKSKLELTISKFDKFRDKRRWRGKFLPHPFGQVQVAHRLHNCQL